MLLFGIYAVDCGITGTAKKTPSCQSSGSQTPGNHKNAGCMFLQVSQRHERTTSASSPEPLQSGDTMVMRRVGGNGHLTVELDGSVDVKPADGSELQRFTIHRKEGSGVIKSRDDVFISEWNGNLLKIADSHEVVIIRKAGTGPILSGETVFLMAWIDASNGQAPELAHSSWGELSVEKLESAQTVTTTADMHSAEEPSQTIVRFTKEGECECKREWWYRGEHCADYCCNPDNDPQGEWCFTSGTCSQGAWGLCAQPVIPESGSMGGGMVESSVDTTSDQTAIEVTRTTKQGQCQCQKEWWYQGVHCTDSCCNPDNDSGGDWCFTVTPCEHGMWDFCAPENQAVTSRSDGPEETIVQEEVVPLPAWEHYVLVKEARRQGFTCPDGTIYPPNPVELKFDCGLALEAEKHCKDMIANNYVDTVSPVDQSTPSSRANGSDVEVLAENVAAMTRDARQTLDLFLDSEFHCPLVMNATWTAMGVGYAAGGTYHFYWTQAFGIGGDNTVNGKDCRPQSDGIELPASLLSEGAGHVASAPPAGVMAKPWVAWANLEEAGR